MTSIVLLYLYFLDIVFVLDRQPTEEIQQRIVPTMSQRQNNSMAFVTQEEEK